MSWNYAELSGTLRAEMHGHSQVIVYTKSRRAKDKDDFETWKESAVANTLNVFDGGGTRATTIVVDEKNTDGKKVL